MKEELKQQLLRHEGLRLKPYRCTAGRLTIGVGRNLDAVGISEAEALQMLDHDVDALLARLDQLPVYRGLSPDRQQVIANMVFNLGYDGVMKFRKMWAALAAGDYKLAGKEMLDSRWADQVGDRATELAAMMWTGQQPG